MTPRKGNVVPYPQGQDLSCSVGCDPAGLSQNKAVIPTGSGGFIAFIALSLTASLTNQNSAQELLERLVSSVVIQCRGFTEPFHVQHKDWTRAGAAPAHPQHQHECGPK